MNLDIDDDEIPQLLSTSGKPEDEVEQVLDSQIEDIQLVKVPITIVTGTIYNPRLLFPISVGVVRFSKL